MYTQNKNTKVNNRAVANVVKQKKTLHYNRQESRTVANSITKNKSNAKHKMEFINNRPEAIVQRNFQKMVNKSQHLANDNQFEVKEDNGATQQLQSIQLRKSNDNLTHNSFTKQIQPLQRMRDLPSGGKVLEQDDTLKKRELFMKHIKKFEELGRKEQADKLREQLKQYPELGDEEVIFKSVGTAQPESIAYALWAHSSSGPYYIFPTSYAKPTEEIDATLADGKYQFAITVEHPSEALVGTGGHDSLAKQGNVWYAGTIYFNHGQLQRWNNDTGHYRTTPKYRTQALRAPTDDLSGGLLPLSKFEVYKL